MYRFRDMLRADHVALSQVCNGAADFQHAMIGAGTELELPHGGLKQRAGRLIHLAKLFDFACTPSLHISAGLKFTRYRFIGNCDTQSGFCGLFTFRCYLTLECAAHRVIIEITEA